MSKITKFKICVKISDLNLNLTLQNGQSFRWLKIDGEKWRGVVLNKIWTLHQNENEIFCEVVERNKIHNQKVEKVEDLYTRELACFEKIKVATSENLNCGYFLEKTKKRNDESRELLNQTIEMPGICRSLLKKNSKRKISPNNGDRRRCSVKVENKEKCYGSRSLRSNKNISENCKKEPEDESKTSINPHKILDRIANEYLKYKENDKVTINPPISKTECNSRIYSITTANFENVIENKSNITENNPTNGVNKSSLQNEDDEKNCDTENKDIFCSYFRLKTSLNILYSDWSRVDEKFANISEEFRGIRILDQECVENVFSFICSSNNNIERITKLVEKLCCEFGEYIATIDNVDYFGFPAIESLAKHGNEAKMRELGFGYRAKYIEKSARMILEKGGKTWLDSLKRLSYEECRAEIIKLAGVGPKVADCICLMSMGHLDTIPVDTHVYQIAASDYLPHLRGKKSVTKAMYTEIAEYFKSLYGPYAGWAHSVLFTADLRKFKARNVRKVIKNPN